MNKKIITGVISAAMVMSMSGMMVFADEVKSEISKEDEMKKILTTVIERYRNDNGFVAGDDGKIRVTPVENNGVAINQTNFPDAKFAEAVSEMCDANQDGYLSEEEIANTTELMINGRNITSIEGIKYFTNLSRLACGSNDIESIDLSGNTSLTLLYCGTSNLSSLDISGCTSLEYISCCSSNLTSLDLSTNTALKGIFLVDNQLSTIDISNNPSLLEAYSENCYPVIFEELNGNVYGKTISREEFERNWETSVLFFKSGTEGNNADDYLYTSWDIIFTDPDTVIETGLPTPAAEPTATPAPTAAPTAAPTTSTKPTTTPAATPAPKSDMVSFAERLYTKALGRNYDKAGRDYWVAQMQAGMTGTEVAKRFFFSDEYMNANHNDADFVATLYRTFMNREYDQAGFDFWMNEIANGCSRENILARFAACPEFGNICANAGIAR